MASLGEPLFRLAIAADQEPQSWVHLIPDGEIHARDGRHFSLSDPNGVIQHFRDGGIDLPIDYEHQADRKQTGTGPVPAAGWIKDLKHQADGLWGLVEWTDRARALITAKEYRFLSPSLLFEETTKKIVKLKGAGLVHKPALHLTALASEENGMDTEKQNDDLLASLLKLLNMDPESTVEDALEVLKKALTDKAPDPSKFVPVEALTDLMRDRNKQVATLSEDRAAQKVKDALDRGFITPAMKGWATALCQHDADSFDAFLENTVPAFAHLHQQILPSGAPKNKSQFETSVQGGLEAAVCDQLGLASGALSKV